MNDKAVKTITVNRRAYHDYEILETIEAGLVLTGTEIKSVRLGHINLRDGYALPERAELWLYNVHIAPYPGGNRFNHEPTRRRKLLLHRGEIARLAGYVNQHGFALIPLQLYIAERGIAKVELGLARGKKDYDKREAIAQRDSRRRIERAIRHSL